ncbi:unnamed protein product [Ceutorhynchus assimilis]|uniref:RCC1-like domain-containing protein n=1 Tax=Ceutorhynchus assimilis TaxID=467358 RepID=A0A9N9MWA0_9CUCU|nr:unnamed protein product [Ceutorhynchus assimilis]
MSSFRKINEKLVTLGVRYVSGPKRKYPINPALADDLPVFQYKPSKKTHRVFCWGNAQTGALGIKGLLEKEATTLRFPKRLGFGEKFEVVTAAAGYGFTVFAIDSSTDVKLYGTGINSDSQLGLHEIRKDHPLEIIFYPQPISLPIRYPETTKILKLAAGRAHLLVLTDEGVFLLGNNAYGQCGRKIIPNEDYIKSNVINHLDKIDGKNIVDVECGQDHSLLLAEDGSVYTCGWGADGQTGLGHFKSTENFSKVEGDIQGEKIVQLACKSDFVLALNDKGEAFGWGNTEYGQISLPNNEQQLANPTCIDMVNKLGKITSVASGGSFCLVANDSGQVFSWGYGLLGLGPNADMSKKPLKIPETLFGRNDFQPDTRVIKVRCGLNYSAAVTNSGDLFVWGRNRDCCLGLGHEKDQYFPLKVAIGGFVQDVFCGLDHTVALCKPFI